MPPTDAEMRTAAGSVMRRAELIAYEHRSGREFRVDLSKDEGVALAYNLHGHETLTRHANTLNIELLTQIWNLRGRQPTSLKFRKK